MKKIFLILIVLLNTSVLAAQKMNAVVTYNPKLKTIRILQENSYYAMFTKMVY